jgi:hypothetical protein
MAAIRAGQGLLAGLLRCGHDEETKQRERFLIAAPPDLDESVLYAKERRLVEMVQSEAKNRRAVQIYATYTQNVT